MLHQALRADVFDFLQIHVELDVLAGPLGLQQHHRLTDLLVQPVLGGGGPDGLVVHPGDQQNVPHQGGQTAGVEQNPLHVARLLLGGGAALEQHGVALDGVDGGLELVGYVGDEVALQGFGGGQSLHHQVEALVAVADLRDAAFRLKLHGEVPLGYALHGAAEAHHRAQHKDVHCDGHRHADGQAEKHQPHQGMHLDGGVQQAAEQGGKHRGQQERAQNLQHGHQNEQQAQVQSALLFFLAHACLTTL